MFVEVTGEKLVGGGGGGFLTPPLPPILNRVKDSIFKCYFKMYDTFIFLKKRLLIFKT